MQCQLFIAFIICRMATTAALENLAIGGVHESRVLTNYQKHREWHTRSQQRRFSMLPITKYTEFTCFHVCLF